MQYNAGFLLYQLQYLADYEERTTVKNATSWSHKANNSPFCNVVQLQWVTLKCVGLGKSINPGEKQGSFLRGVPRYPPCLIYSKHQISTTQPYLFVTNSIWN